jgi:hypothetical protein
MRLATKQELITQLNQDAFKIYTESVKAGKKLTRDQLATAMVFLIQTKDILKIK